MDIEITKENKTQFEKDMCAAAYMGMSYGRYKAYQKTLAEKRKARKRKARSRTWEKEKD